MGSNEEIDTVVDEMVDEMDQVRIERETERLNITLEALMQRVTTELRARVENIR